MGGGLKAPRGGTPPATPLREHFAHRRQDTEAQAFEADVLWLGKILAANAPTLQDKLAAKCLPPKKAFRHRLRRPKPSKIKPEPFKIEARRLQNRARNPPRWLWLWLWLRLWL